MYEASPNMSASGTPLGEINLPFVASNAIIPRCRRNRRQTESHQACLNGRGAKEGNSKLTDAYPASAEKLQINLRFLSACTNFNLLRSQGRRTRKICGDFVFYSQKFNLLASHRSHKSHRGASLRPRLSALPPTRMSVG